MDNDFYKFVLVFDAHSNEDGEVMEKSIFLHECPKNSRETRKLIENTYDGVWVPQVQTNILFQLTVVV